MRRRAHKVLVSFAAVLLFASAAGCAAEQEPLPAARRVTVVVCTSLNAKRAVDGSMPTLQSLAERGAIALVASSPQEVTPLGQTATGSAVELIDAGDAASQAAAVDRAVAQAQEGAEGEAIVVISEPSGSANGFVCVAGKGIPAGLLVSVNTHRAGLIAAEDVAALVRELAGELGPGSRPVLSVVPARRAPDPLARSEAYFEAARAAQAPIVVVFGVLACVSVLALWALPLSRLREAARRYWTVVLSRTLLLSLCVPPATLLARVLERYPATAPRLLTLTVGAAGVLWIVAMAVMERRGVSAAVAAVCAFAAAVASVDQLLGAPLAPGTAFSYAPLAGFRFYGIGNEGAAIVLGSWLTAGALGRGWLSEPAWRRVTLASGILVVSMCSLPVLGANSVVAVWGTVVAGVFLAETARGRLAWRDVALIAIAAAIAIAVVVGVERLTGAGTHVGLAVREASGTGGAIGILLERLTAVLRAYVEHPLALVGFTAWLVLAAVRLRPPAKLGTALADRPAVRSALTAALAGGAVSSLTEDSSVVVMVLLALFAGVALSAATADESLKEA